jgi:hypothetical protein
MRSKLATCCCVATLAALTACSRALVHDPTVSASTPLAGHCAGSEWADNSSLAAVPIPVVAFLSPQVDLNKIEADDYLKRCGDPTGLTNRDVEVDSSACVPASITRIVTLGIYQWCPAHVDWAADVATQPTQVYGDSPVQP